MGAPAIGIGIAAIGTGFQLYGQRKANKAQKESLRDEQAAIEDQRNFLRKQKEQKLELMKEEASELFGNQASAMAANGIDLSGSALSMAINDQMKAERAQQLTAQEFDFNIKMGGFRKDAIDKTIANINKSSKWNTVSTILGGMGSAYTNYRYMGGGIGSTTSTSGSSLISGGEASQPFSGSPNIDAGGLA